MKKKGFLLIETIVVITVLTYGLVTLYGLYLRSMSDNAIALKYDKPEYIYKTYYVGSYLYDDFIAYNETESDPDHVFYYSLHDTYKQNNKLLPSINEAALKSLMESLDIESIMILNVAEHRWKSGDWGRRIEPYMSLYFTSEIETQYSKGTQENAIMLIAKFKEDIYGNDILKDTNIASVFLEV